ncbi:unnamed protein product [Zymoseptoria tritici ST99CH_3D1]|nr:unnamed protein product [Zymoseptoria tritici ST99CH_3D1]
MEGRHLENLLILPPSLQSSPGTACPRGVVGAVSSEGVGVFEKSIELEELILGFPIMSDRAKQSQETEMHSTNYSANYPPLWRRCKSEESGERIWRSGKHTDSGFRTLSAVGGTFFVCHEESSKFADTFGRKVMLYIAVALSLASSFALVFAPNLPVLFVSKLLLGLSVGLSTAIPPLYVTENAPAHLRSTASSLTNVVIVLGFFCSSLTGYGASKIEGVWSFKLAFLMTFVVPALYGIVLPFFPESPVWYMKKGREADARKAIFRLFGPDANADKVIETIKRELKQGEEEASGVSQTSWKAIFSKEHRKRTVVAVLGLQSQNFSGGYFANTYQTYYFELIGQTDPFRLTAISSTLQFFSNLVAVALADVIPRRKGLVGGGTLLMFWSIIIAGSSLAAKTNNAANLALLAFMITWSMLYTATVGCFGWAIAQETAAQATRPKTISFVLVCQQLTALMLSSVFPYFINPDQLNWGGKVMFLFVGAEIFIIGLLWLLQPETKNRTNVEIDILYAANIPARKFKDFDIIDGEVVPKQKKGGFLSRFSRKA